MKKFERNSIEETLGYRTVPTVLCANSDLKSYERNTQRLKTQTWTVWLVRKRTKQVGFDFFDLLDPSLLFRDEQLNSKV
jgi:hypothetical protein